MRVDELKESYKKFGALYPVILDKDGNIVDGFHRKRVSENWPEHKVEKIDTPLKREIIGLVANTIRREITGEEITNRLERVAKILEKEEGLEPGEFSSRIADLVGRSQRWVRRYLPQKYKMKYSSKSERRSDFTSKPFLYNVWQSTGKRTKGYGDPNFHGNTPPILAAQCILKYTKKGDLVLDPMAGSGTVIDICKKLGREVIAFDIKPMRDDIKHADAEKLDLDDPADFIFAHWPYWNMTSYSNKKKDLSNLSFSEFKSKSEKIMENMYRILKTGGYFTVLVGDKRKKGTIDLSAIFSLMGSKIFHLYDKIIWVARNQRSLKKTDKNVSEWRAKKYNYHIPTFDTLLIFRKLSKR